MRYQVYLNLFRREFKRGHRHSARVSYYFSNDDIHIRHNNKKRVNGMARTRRNDAHIGILVLARLKKFGTYVFFTSALFLRELSKRRLDC